MKLKEILLIFTLLTAQKGYPNGETYTPNMDLVCPAVGITTGPQWGADIISTFFILDAHDHSPGKGVQITPAGINISSDLSYNDNNITNPRTVRFYPQGSCPSAGTDVGVIYECGVDLYYNDGNGNQVRLTQGGSPAGTPGSISGLSAPASASYVSGSSTFVWQSSTNTPANLDAGSVIVRNITANSKGITISPAASLPANYSITLPAAVPGSSGAFLTESTGGVLSYTNVDGTTMNLSAGTLSVNPGGITTTQIASSAGILGSQLSSSANIVGTQLTAGTLTATQLSSNINLPGANTQVSGYGILGSSGSGNGFAFIRGILNSDGTIFNGEGYTTTRVGDGSYTITFTTSFGDTPAVFVTPVNPAVVASPEFSSITTGGFVVFIRNSSNVPVNSSFTFVAIGKR